MKLKALADAIREEAERLGDGEVAIGYRNSRGDWLNRDGRLNWQLLDTTKTND